MRKFLMLLFLLGSFNYAYSYDQRIQCRGINNLTGTKLIRLDLFRWSNYGPWEADLTVSTRQNNEMFRYVSIFQQRSVLREVKFWGGDFDLRIDIPFGDFEYYRSYLSSFSTRRFDLLNARLICQRLPF